jgi:hypothetical protein
MGTLPLRLFDVVGLILDLFGAVLMMVGVIPSRKHIDEVTRMVYGANAPERSDRRRQSNLVILGLVLLALGFVFQIMGGWPR